MSSKMLLAFDDLCRNSKVLTVGIEQEFKTFVENQKSCRRQWAAAEEELRALKTSIINLQSDNKALDNKLKHARNLIEKEEQKRMRIEGDKDQLERQIAVIRELLVDGKTTSQLDQQARERLAFLSTTTLNQQDHFSPVKTRRSVYENSHHSILSDEDIDWDKTEDDIISPCRAQKRRSKRQGKRPSAPPEELLDDTPPKRHKPVKTEDKEVVTTTTITVTADGRPIEATTEVSVPTRSSSGHGGVRTLNKSFSEPALDKHLIGAESETESEVDPWTPRAGNFNTNASKSSLRNTPSMTPLRKAHSASRGLNRIHSFISETVIRPRTCVPCGKRIGFGRMAMKCKECRSMCHPECKDNLPLPCIAAPPTPGTGKIQGGILADYCRDESPMIPGIVIHCVNEIEARGLSEVGIYRVPGSDRQVKELKEKFFRGKGTPNLMNIDDIHVICGCLKDFLRNLKEPLVTFKLWRTFVHAAENRDKQMAECEMYQALSELPRANRDTIAFLMLHLLRVSQTPDCKMPANNLSRVFGPTIVGHSTQDLEPAQLINETKYQAMVMDKLFEIPDDYWINFIQDDDLENVGRTVINTPQTPERTHGLLASRLGPVHTPGSGYDSHTWTSRAAYTPRFGERTRNVTKKPSHFFNSPSVD